MSTDPNFYILQKMSTEPTLPPLRPSNNYPSTEDVVPVAHFKESANYWFRAYNEEVKMRPIESARVIQDLIIRLNRLEKLLSCVLGATVGIIWIHYCENY